MTIDVSIARSTIAFLLITTSSVVFAQTFEQGMKLYNAGSLDKAVSTWKQAALNGDVESQAMLADIYFKGKGTIGEDSAEAKKWYRMAAFGGNANAQFYMGANATNPVDRCAWLRIADNNGYRAAGLMLGQIRGDLGDKCAAKMTELYANIKHK